MYRKAQDGIRKAGIPNGIIERREGISKFPIISQ